MAGYKFLPHTADLKILAEGRNTEEAFISSALALKEAICGKIKIRARIKKRIHVEGKDNCSLLCSFLEEFLYMLDAEDFLLSRINKIKIKEIGIKDANRKAKAIEAKQKDANDSSVKGSLITNKATKLILTAEVLGDKASDCKFTNEVKAVTYNEMFVKQKKGEEKVFCQFVLDV